MSTPRRRPWMVPVLLLYTLLGGAAGYGIAFTLDGRPLWLRDLPPAWFPWPEGSLENPLAAEQAALTCSYLLDCHRFAEAAERLQALQEEGTALPILYRDLLACDLLTCRLLVGKGAAAEEALLTPAVRKTMEAMKTSPDVLRTQYLCALLAHRDPQAARELQHRFETSARTHPYPGEVAGARELMVLAQIKEVTP